MSTDLLARAQNMLLRVRQEHLATARSLVYERKSGTRIELTMTTIADFGAEMETAGTDRVSLGFTPRQYLIPIAEPNWDGLPPEAGDTIEETDAAGTLHVYEVASFAGQDEKRWHDREFTTYRVNCHLLFEQ